MSEVIKCDTFLIGRLTDSIDLRYTQQGVAVANFTLAVERPYTNKQGETVVDFIDIVVCRKQAENCANHLGKGRLVAVEGSMRQNRWKDDNGNNRSSLEVQADNVRFLDYGSDNESQDSVDVPF